MRDFYLTGSFETGRKIHFKSGAFEVRKPTPSHGSLRTRRKTPLLFACLLSLAKAERSFTVLEPAYLGF